MHHHLIIYFPLNYSINQLNTLNSLLISAYQFCTTLLCHRFQSRGGLHNTYTISVKPVGQEIFSTHTTFHPTSKFQKKTTSKILQIKAKSVHFLCKFKGLLFKNSPKEKGQRSAFSFNICATAFVTSLLHIRKKIPLASCPISKFLTLSHSL